MRRSRLCIKLASAVEELSRSPLNHIGDLTITFPLDADLKAIQRSLRFFYRNVLQRSLNTKGLRIITRVGSRYHVHFLVDFNTDIAGGFDWAAFQSYQRLHADWLIDRQPANYRLMMIALSNYQQSRNAELIRLQTAIQRWGDSNGFGRCLLLPIRTNLQACRFYLQSNLPHYRTESEKGLHWLAHWGLEVIKDCQFQPHNHWYQQMRTRLNRFVQQVGLTADTANDTMNELYGPRWRWQFRTTINDINQPSPEQLNQLQHIRQNCLIHRLRQQL